MKLHLVAGFLGSGKTTAIIHACKTLLRQGRRAGVITNDQGKYLVDTAFVRLNDLPAVEVGGGCFCCNYVDLEKQLAALIEMVRPEVIFAESVGSCADLVATVVKPMLELLNSPYRPASFSTFVDARLLRMRLNGAPLPFSDNVVYIFDKQIEETRLLVVNKIDLLDEQQKEALLDQAHSAYPDKQILPQVSLSEAGVAGWLQNIQEGQTPLPDVSLEIDYQRYGEGEGRLGWLDEELIFETSGDGGREAAVTFMQTVLQLLQKAQASVGHIKFVLRGSAAGEGKLSFVSYEQTGWQAQVPPLAGGELHILVNARVELPAEKLAGLFAQAAAETAQKMGLAWSQRHVQSFHPSFPRPTHRIE